MTTHIPRYYEIRTILPLFGPPSPIASDIARHLQSRQYLGMTVVVCANPFAMLSATRKQWLRLARNLQKQRASTLNAEEILRFTHTIMHMQHLQFAAKIPTEHSEGHIFFVSPSELTYLPHGCVSLYLTAPPTSELLAQWIASLSPDSLLIDYNGNIDLTAFDLRPKEQLEERMMREWHMLQRYMRQHEVETSSLIIGTSLRPQAMDAALDAMLAAGNEFLRRAASFQHILNLAQPLTNVAASLLKEIEAVMRLAHRAQSLSPGAFGDFLIKTFGDTNADSFFLRDATPENDDILSDLEPKEDITYLDAEESSLIIEYI